MQTKKGIVYFRKCFESEIKHLEEVYTSIKHKLLAKNEISWINTYLNG